MQQLEHFKDTYKTQRRFQWFSALALAALTLTTGLAMAKTPDAGLPGKGIKVQALQSPIAEETFQTMLVDLALEKLGYAIRDEINLQKYTRGAVGTALSGPDTGGSQFFIKDPGDQAYVSWHQDGTYLEQPPMGTFLQAHVLPASGGDTCFANTYAAFDDLPAEERARPDGAPVAERQADAELREGAGAGERRPARDRDAAA